MSSTPQDSAKGSPNLKPSVLEILVDSNGNDYGYLNYPHSYTKYRRDVASGNATPSEETSNTKTTTITAAAMKAATEKNAAQKSASSSADNAETEGADEIDVNYLSYPHAYHKQRRHRDSAGATSTLTPTNTRTEDSAEAVKALKAKFVQSVKDEEKSASGNNTRESSLSDDDTREEFLRHLVGV